MWSLPSAGLAHAGPVAVIRALGRGDAAPLDDVLAGLSPRSRYLRFHSPIPALTARCVACCSTSRPRPRGVTRLHARVLSGNVAALELIRAVFPAHTARRDDDASTWRPGQLVVERRQLSVDTSLRL